VSHSQVPFDGTTEGPLFDGIRLVLKDYRPAQVDAGGTRWEIGSSPYHFTISLPVIDMGGYTLTGFAYPADYTITISDAVVDTSSSAIFWCGADSHEICCTQYYGRPKGRSGLSRR